MKKAVVFCGSSFGTDTVYEEQAYLLGQTLAEKGIELIYGGAQVGLMGAVANGTLSKGGRVTGVLPHFLGAKEIAHPALSELILVESMHERKKIMSDLCEGIIALPGGLGTLEELFEMLTWAQLGLHGKPVALFNIKDFWNPLIHLVDAMVDKGFVKQLNRDMMLVEKDVDIMLTKMENYVAPYVPKWIKREEV